MQTRLCGNSKTDLQLGVQLHQMIHELYRNQCPLYLNQEAEETEKDLTKWEWRRPKVEVLRKSSLSVRFSTFALFKFNDFWPNFLTFSNWKINPISSNKNLQLNYSKKRQSESLTFIQKWFDIQFSQSSVFHVLEILQVVTKKNKTNLVAKGKKQTFKFINQ